jgi:hypothetical protein
MQSPPRRHFSLLGLTEIARAALSQRDVAPFRERLPPARFLG